MFSVVRLGLRARYAPFLLLCLIATLSVAAVTPALHRDSLFLFAALWLLGLLSALAVRASLRRFRAAQPVLLTRRALRRPPLPLPPVRQMRAELARLLASPAPLGTLPESPEHALRRILERSLACQRARSAADLTPRGITELWLLVTLLRATPERAGGLARCFRLPDMVLDLHDRVHQIAAQHAAATAQAPFSTQG
ncbi:hypothetical protein CLG85_022520 [Yangia mangrovi]|uniref:DUF4129 domain-containing protein n=2 Tax=Alloyangia mangrovi TaxID=1779329 RepID=A0ABT2KS22_9RHOB|nr:hypothetical protein [Alloyangia mangrovi]MCA0946414.1 hypothetical protein [Alloyangia pacifica]MCT4372925.1 hypothetical protein [Alloyangia mangrovi]